MFISLNLAYIMGSDKRLYLACEKEVLDMENTLVTEAFLSSIRMHLPMMKMEDAFQLAADILRQNNQVREGYAKCMMEREREHCTYLDYGIAIPHGTEASQSLIVSSGICILHFDSPIAYSNQHNISFMIAIACKEEDDIQELLQLTDILSKDDMREKLLQAQTPYDIITIMNENYSHEGGI